MDIQPYIETFRQRRRLEREQLQQKRQKALQVAKAAAQMLWETFGVSRVVVFGSVLDPQAFHTESDIDLAVWDLPTDCYLQAVAKLLDLPEFLIDLVPAESAHE